jgi:hypothetical protein
MIQSKRRNFAIRFQHPGKETDPKYFDNNGLCKWKSRPSNVNSNVHSRKYLITNGKYFNSLTGATVSGEIGFWGEWEAESDVKVNNSFVSISQVNQLPQYFHYPVRPSSTPSKPGIHFENTDPCVFGGQFYYSNCQQMSKTAKYLRDLIKGDVLIFGSTLSPRNQKLFVIDTVFVVKDKIHYTPRKAKQILGKAVPDWFYHLTLDLLPDEEFILYIGATFDEPVEGMYSFFPCSPTSLKPEGFLRPSLLNGKIEYLSKSGQTQGTGRVWGFDAYTVWKEVAEYILNQGLFLGVYAEI